MKKIGIIVIWSVITVLSATILLLFEKYNITLGTVVSGAILGNTVVKVYKSIEDVVDTSDWKVSQRKLKRGGFIKDDTIIRISFAYLYRIKVGDKYFLVKNSRNTGKYQPVGGVYKFYDSEKLFLKNTFHVIDDNKIPIDESSRDDYRLCLENKYLRKFIKRLDSRDASRERINNVGRELKEELVDTGIVKWDSISYRYCGRHFTGLRFGDHFQMYELLIFDIIELLPTLDQEQDLKNLMKSESKDYIFATEEQITCLGMNIKAGSLLEMIGDHTKTTLQENETKLMKMPETGNKYDIMLI